MNEKIKSAWHVTSPQQMAAFTGALGGERTVHGRLAGSLRLCITAGEGGERDSEDSGKGGWKQWGVVVVEACF